MKHIVELQYTNPSHEHVSLRRRVETVNRVVEAQSAEEALNRAANQQRALGFRIQSANVVEQKEELSEATDYKALEKPTFMRIKSGETKPVDRTDYNKPTYLRKKEKEEKPKNEETESVDEADMRFDPEAAARPKSSDVKNFLNRNVNRRAAAASKKYIRRMTKLGGLGPNQTKKDTETHMKDYFEEVEQVEEGIVDSLKKAQVKWKTAHRAVYGKDPTVKSMAIGAIARLGGAKAHTARSVSTQLAGKPVTAQQQAAAKARAGKVGMAKMRSEEKETADQNDVNSGVKGKVAAAADKMSKKAAEIRKSKIEGDVNQINLEPTIDLHRPASLDPNKRIQK